MRPWPCSIIQRATSCVRKCGPLIGRNQFVEALFSRIQNVAAFTRSHAGIVHQQVEASVLAANVFDQSMPVGTRRDVAPTISAPVSAASDSAASLPAAIGRDQGVSFR